MGKRNVVEVENEVEFENVSGLGFELLVVLFILLIIIGAYYFNSGKCCYF